MSYLKRPLPAPQLAEVSFKGDSNHEIAVLTDQRLFDDTGVCIAFTLRHGGYSSAPYASLNLGSMVNDDLTCVQANRQLLLDALGCDACAVDIVAPRQVHGDCVLIVDGSCSAQEFSMREADSVICVDANVPVQLCFADCTPVILVAPNGSFAVAHAGWRGALAKIVGKTLKVLCAQANCEAGECNIYIGPHIGSCCYEVSQDLLDQFVSEFGQSCNAGNLHLSLSAAVMAQAQLAGADMQRVLDCELCTSCNVDSFYSYRAENGTCGRHGALAIRKR